LKSVSFFYTMQDIFLLTPERKPSSDYYQPLQFIAKFDMETV